MLLLHLDQGVIVLIGESTFLVLLGGDDDRHPPAPAHGVGKVPEVLKAHQVKVLSFISHQ